MARRTDRARRTARSALGIVLGMLAADCERAAAGPLPSANLAPQHLFFLEPAPESASVAEGRAFTVDLAYATIYSVSKSGRTRETLDMEVARAALRFAQGLPYRAEVGAEIPLLWMGSGVFDGPLNRYHGSTGFGDGGRRNGPTNEFRYSVTDGTDTYRPDPNGRVGLGDAVLRLKKEVATAPASAVRLAVRALAKLPTGDPGKGYGSGHPDGGLGALVETRIGPFRLHGALDGLYLGGTPDPVLSLSTHWALKAAGGLSIPAWDLGDLTVQIDYLSTPYGTGSSHLDRDVVMLAAGFQRAIEGFGRWAVGFTEDLSARASPDFSLFFSLEWQP